MNHKQADNPKKCKRYIIVTVLVIGIISILGIQTQPGMAKDNSRCKAFWSRTTLSVGGYYIGATLDRQFRNPDYSIASSSPLSAGLSVYTYMGNSLDSSRSCGTADANNPVPAPVYTNCGIFMTKSN